MSLKISIEGYSDRLEMMLKNKHRLQAANFKLHLETCWSTLVYARQKKEKKPL